MILSRACGTRSATRDETSSTVIVHNQRQGSRRPATFAMRVPIGGLL